MEYQLVGEATLQTLRAADETLVELPSAELEPRSNRPRRYSDASAGATAAAQGITAQPGSNGAGPAGDAGAGDQHPSSARAGDAHVRHASSALPPHRSADLGHRLRVAVSPSACLQLREFRKR